MSSVEVGSDARGEVNHRSCFWEDCKGVHLFLMKVATMDVVRSSIGCGRVEDKSCMLYGGSCHGAMLRGVAEERKLSGW